MDKDPPGHSDAGNEANRALPEESTAHEDSQGRSGSGEKPDPDCVRDVVGCPYCQQPPPVGGDIDVADSLQRILSPSICPACRQVGWTGIVRHYFWRLCRYAKKVLGCSAEDAEDIAQDSLIRAEANIQTFEGTTTERFSGFLMTICRNRAIDVGRRATRERRLLDSTSVDAYVEAAEAEADEAYHKLPPALTDPDFATGVVQQMTTWLHFRSAFASLSPRQQQCFWRFYQGKSYEEIAAELGISQGAVGRYISEARKRLAALMWHVNPGYLDDEL